MLLVRVLPPCDRGQLHQQSHDDEIIGKVQPPPHRPESLLVLTGVKGVAQCTVADLKSQTCQPSLDCRCLHRKANDDEAMYMAVDNIDEMCAAA